MRGFTALPPPVPLDNRLKAKPRDLGDGGQTFLPSRKKKKIGVDILTVFILYLSLLPLRKTLNGKHLSLTLSCMISSLAGIQSKCFVMHCTGRPGEESISYTLIISVMK